jgi:hypothetical protein
LDEEEEETQLLQMQNANQFSESGNKNFNPHCKCKEQGNPQTSLPCFCNSSSPVGNGFLYLSTLVPAAQTSSTVFFFTIFFDSGLVTTDDDEEEDDAERRRRRD